jgi:hypothetical protein
VNVNWREQLNATGGKLSKQRLCLSAKLLVIEAPFRRDRRVDDDTPPDRRVQMLDPFSPRARRPSLRVRRVTWERFGSASYNRYWVCYVAPNGNGATNKRRAVGHCDYLVICFLYA